MGFVYGPGWFYGMDASFEVVAMLVTALIGLYSFRVFLLTKLRRYVYFTLAFLSLSASYFIRSVADFVVYTHLTKRIPNVIAAVSGVVELPSLYSWAYLAYLFLGIGGFLILAAVYMRIKNLMTISLLFLLVVVLAYISQSRHIAFHLAAGAMLFFIVLHHVRNHSRKRTFTSFLVLYSMACLFVAQVFFMLLGIDAVYYAVGHVLQLVGFVLLLANMVVIFRKG